MDDQMDQKQILPHDVDPKQPRLSLLRLLEWSMRKVDPKSPDQTEQLIQELFDQIQEFSDAMVREHEKTQAEKRLDVLKQSDWHDSPDAMVWAIKLSEKLTTSPADGSGIEANDVGTLVSWFASAMSVGGRQRSETLSENYEKAWKAGEAEALKKYEGQLKEMAQKIVAQRQEIDEIKDLNGRQVKTIASLQAEPASRQFTHKESPSLDVAGHSIKPGQERVMTPPRNASYGSPFDPYDPTKGEDPQRPNKSRLQEGLESGEIYVNHMEFGANGEVKAVDITLPDGERYTAP